MPSGLIAYDPQRVEALRRAAVAAHDHLLGTPRVDDPLAAGAIAMGRVVGGHLEHGWLPTLTRLAASRAMLGFDARGPGVELGAAFGFGLSTPMPEPGPPRAIPVSWGTSNAAAWAAAEAAMAAGAPGRFVGRTQTYEVIETPPSTSIPASGHDPDGGSGSYGVIVEDHWLYEHNLNAPPPLYGTTPGGPWARLVVEAAELLRDVDGDDVAHERGLAFEELCKEARGRPGPGGISWRKNVAVGRLTMTGGDGAVTEYPRVLSGERDREGYLPNPTNPRFVPEDGREYDTEVKILEDVATRLAIDDDGLVEIFTERPPCPSCRRVIAQFHAMFPNVQVRVYYRDMEVQVN